MVCLFQKDLYFVFYVGTKGFFLMKGFQIEASERERFGGLGCFCSVVSELGSLSSTVPMQIVSQYLMLSERVFNDIKYAKLWVGTG